MKYQGIFFILLFLIGCSVFPSSHQSISTPMSIPDNEKKTVVPAVDPFAQPPLIHPVRGRALLGSPLGTFIGAYGQPNAQSEAGLGEYRFGSTIGSQANFLLVGIGALDEERQGNPHDLSSLHVLTISVYAAEKSPWSVSQAYTNCAVFLPPDAVYERHIPILMQRDETVYTFQLLATQFEKNALLSRIDRNVGLFSMTFFLDAHALVNSCSLALGL